MNSSQLSPLALSAGLACMLTASLAHANCTGTENTVSLASTTSAPLTEVAINNVINNAPNPDTVGNTPPTVINLSGTFNISSAIKLPKDKNCIKLQSPDGTPPATLKWNTASPLKEFMIEGAGNQGITLNNLILQDRSIVFIADQHGIANTTINNVRFINPKTTDVAASGANYILRLLADTTTKLAKGWTVTNNTFVVAAEQDKPYHNTAIIGYLGDTVNISGNTFTNVDEGIHYQGLRNAKINNNTGTGLLRSAIELQEGMAIAPTKVNFSNTNITVDGNKFTNWRAVNDSNWPAGSEPYNGGRIVLGLSIASGNYALINNNKLLFNGSSLSTCQNSTVARTAWERWGIELTTVNASLTNNQFCGFDYGARVGFVGNEAGPMGVDKTTIKNNTFANLFLTGIEMFPGDINRHGRPFGQKPDSTESGVYTELPLDAKVRWGKILDSYNRQMIISNNVFADVRIAAFAGGGTWFDHGTGDNTGTVKINGVVQTGLKRVPENFGSHLAALTITNNQISRKFGKFATDTVPTDLSWNDQRFLGLIVPAIRIGSSLNVSGNTISLTNSPSTPSTDFRFDGIFANTMLSDDDGKNYDTAKTFNGSLIQGNTVSASPSPFGYGVRTRDAVVETWTGISVNNNTLTNLFKGIYSEGGRVYPGVNNNTCSLGC